MKKNTTKAVLGIRKLGMDYSQNHETLCLASGAMSVNMALTVGQAQSEDVIF